MLTSLLLLLFLSHFTCHPDSYEEEEFFEAPVEEIKLRLKSNFTLCCNRMQRDENEKFRQTGTWKFLPYVEYFGGEEVTKMGSNNWKVLSKGRWYKIINASEESSGYYRCEKRNFVKTYLVEVEDSTFKVLPPRIISLTYTKLPPNPDYTIACKVTSVCEVRISWLKLCQETKYTMAYEGQFYCHLNTSITSYSYDRFYVSKLHIHNARVFHTGVYVCLVLGCDKAYKNITITIPSLESSETSPFLLFLIPIVLVKIPLIIWLCCYRKKTKRERHKRLLKSVEDYDKNLV